jgi:acyl carrier protein
MTSIQDTRDKVMNIFHEILHIEKEQITPDATLESLGVDSLDKLEIIMKLEETFGIEINDKEAAKISTVQEAIEKVHALRSKQSVSP